MRELAARDILRVWEHGRTATPAERAVRLLAAGGGDAPETVPAGARDAALLELRVRTFGPRLEAVATCPACAERLDVELPAEGLRAGAPEPEPLVLDAGGRCLELRLPTAADLVDAAAAADAAAGRALLLERCVPGGGELPTEVAEAVAARLAEADSGALIDVALACPACEHEWELPFDVVAYLWAELDAAARRLLEDVHMLASAYGWREDDVLALSAPRRAAYLDLVGA